MSHTATSAHFRRAFRKRVVVVVSHTFSHHSCNPSAVRHTHTQSCVRERDGVQGEDRKIIDKNRDGQRRRNRERINRWPVRMNRLDCCCRTEGAREPLLVFKRPLPLCAPPPELSRRARPRPGASRALAYRELLPLSLSPRRRSLSRDSGVRRAARSTCKQERRDALSSASVLAEELFFFKRANWLFFCWR